MARRYVAGEAEQQARLVHTLPGSIQRAALRIGLGIGRDAAAGQIGVKESTHLEWRIDILDRHADRNEARRLAADLAEAIRAVGYDARVSYGEVVVGRVASPEDEAWLRAHGLEAA